MNNGKTAALLGFAAKAGKLSYGAAAAEEAIRRGKARLAVAARDISAKSFKEIKFQAAKKNIPVVLLRDFDINAVSSAVGRKCGILSVNDSSFADAVIAAVQSGGNANEQQI